MSLKITATIEDLYRVPENGKAELVDRELVIMAATGFLPGFAGGEIYSSLRSYGMNTQRGYGLPDNVGYLVNLPARSSVSVWWESAQGWQELVTDLPKRSSFSPDAAFFTGTLPANLGKFLEGAPILAVEVRSENDYGETAEKEIAKKRVDYFDAGTLVVWDVDVLRGQLIKVYRASDPLHPTVYLRGENAEAEPALPGWRMEIERLFPPIFQ
ncbi:MAG TPA: Uma2 family endonuclease [Cyanobacteria bacterium UBA8803]|nr:Uma2 family endonuclease [Cyanobacteria bacterium UBA8803]